MTIHLKAFQYYFSELYRLCECLTVQCFVQININFRACFLILETLRIEIADTLNLNFKLLVLAPGLEHSRNLFIVNLYNKLKMNSLLLFRFYFIQIVKQAASPASKEMKPE